MRDHSTVPSRLRDARELTGHDEDTSKPIEKPPGQLPGSGKVEKE